MTHTDILLVYRAGGDGPVAAGLEEAGFGVTTVDSATEALGTLSQDEFDALVSSYHLPGDDGLSLVEAVRAMDNRVPAVLYAADRSLAEEAFDAGIDRFVARDSEESVAKLVDELRDLTTPGGDAPPQRDISEHEPAPEDIVRAIDEAPMGISLCDPSLPDYPLVYVNDAWEEMTGYTREEVLGRNPRLLQGPETADEATETIGAAIESGTSITAEIRNYRRDGTPFWNELTLAPIREDGEVELYVGFQNDVTARKNTENLAAEQAAKLTQEKRTLRRILGRVNGLLNEITHVLVEENQRPIIVQQVCNKITAEEGYAACWFGSLDTTGDSLEIEAQAGLREPVNTTLSLDAVPNAVGETADSDELSLCQAGRKNANHLTPGEADAHRLLTVPVSDSQQTYGILGVYSESLEALDRREQQLFASIGTMIASRLDAIQTAQILTADCVIEVKLVVRDPSFPLSAIAQTLDTDVEYVGMTNDSDAGTYELFLAAPVPVQPDAVIDCSFVEDVREISATNETQTFALTVSTAEPFAELADYGASVTKVTAGPEQATLVLELPPEQDVRTMLAVLEEQYDGIDLRSRQERDARNRTMNEFAAAVDDRLTARQRAAVEAAYMNGYFEWPRPTDGAEIADTMGITRQTFHQHLRAAKRKLIDAYVERYGTTSGDTVLAQQQ